MKKLALVVALGSIIGLSSCGDGYSIELDKESVNAVASSTGGVETAQDATVADSGPAATARMSLLAKEAFNDTSDCDTGHMTMVGDISETSMDLTIELSQCTFDGEEATGTIVLKGSEASETFTLTGDVTFKGIPGITSVAYEDIDATISFSDEEINMDLTMDLDIVSDEVTGKVGIAMMTNETTSTFTIIGDKDTEFVAVTDLETGESTCELNGDAINCEEFEL